MLQIENELKTQIAYVFSKYHQDTNCLQYSNFETLSYTNNQKTIVIVSHDEELVERADRIINI